MPPSVSERDFISLGFAWLPFRLIHSEKQVLCAIDGTFGGFVSHHWLAPSAHTIAAQVVLVLCGAFLGAPFGIFNWQVVSIRLLRVRI